VIKSLLIANRGEIACRVIRTARELGIRTIAVYSDADAGALHVRLADDAVHIGPSPARESYLVGDKIIVAAKQSGAEAIHPGYGFLSENADFAQAVIDAGLIWVGPKPASIRAMGLKDAAKKLMADAGVPVTPGYLGEDQDPARLKQEADAIGYPVLIKAVAGGGGKGMRRVDNAAAFDDALDSCKREAASSFGDDRVLIEKYILSPRHIEVQVFGDSHGNVVHLFERDCSLQRRHQKVIEEAPAPAMDAETRQAVCGAAVRAAQAVNYEGAGTIEFIADASEGLRADRVWFMEMNTRLQVEHPVTEEITGQDLVEWQLRVACGESLPLRQDQLAINGHAIEARLYAEDPAKGFLPSVGKLELFDSGSTVRVETGVEEGDSISSFYDPMIAKLVAKGRDRDEAMLNLATALLSLRVWPVKTNAAFLLACLNDPNFRAGQVTTSLIADAGDRLTTVEAPGPEEWAVAALDLFAPYFAAGERPNAGPWASQFGFRLNAPDRTQIVVQHGNEQRAMDLEECTQATGFATHVDDGVLVLRNAQPFFFSLPRPSARAGAAAADGTLQAPMPGKVTAVEVAVGDKVSKGQRLVTLEAMKMEHALTAPFDGTVAELPVVAGQQVPVDALLIRVEEAAA
jgi:3-methylcrotonyl-CoA carboxylase alpha subunit